MYRQPRQWKVSFFLDKEATQPIDIADLGEIWAGDEGSIVIFMRNDERGKIRDIEYHPASEHVTIIGPKELDPGEMGAITIKWAPSPDAEEGLDEELEITGTLIR